MKMITDYKVGQHVKIAAWTDTFMRGETHGTITKVGRKLVHVRGQRSGRIFKFGGVRLEDGALTPTGA